MALLVGFYYTIESLPLILLALAGWGLLAFLKPSIGLAAVAFAIPFFWHPKAIGQQHFPIVETLLLLVFAAVLARKLTSFLFPSLAEKLHISPDEGLQRPKSEHAKYGVPSTEYQAPKESNHTSRVALRLSSFVFRRSSFTHYALRITHLFKEWNRQDAFGPPAVALLLVGTLSLLTLADPAFARDSARAYRWTIVEPVLFYFLITDVVSSRRGLWRMADFFIAAAVVASLVGLAQFALGADVLAVQGVSRVSGVYNHPNNFALYLGRALPFAVCVGIFLPYGWRKVLYLMAALPMALAAILTYSRGAYVAVTLAVLVAVVVGLICKPHRAKHGPKRWLRVGSSAAAVLVLVALITAASLPRLPERIGHVGSVLIRARIWDSGLRMLADHPILGVGPDQFLNQYQSRYITQEQRDLHEDWLSHPHNILLDYWLNLGILGVFILVWLLWRYFREAVGLAQRMALGRNGGRVSRAIALGLLASMIDFLLHGLADNSYFLMDLAMIFWLSCGLLQLERRNTFEHNLE
jgi:O-antigen ligase